MPLDSLRPLRAAAVGAVLASLLCGPASAAGDGGGFDALRAEVREGMRGPNLWSTLPLAERCGSLPGLSGSQRAEAFRDSGEIRALLGDAVGAERDLKAALGSEPGDPEASYRLAQVTRDRPQEALGYAEQAARAALTPRRRGDAERLAGEIRSDMGDGPGAEAAFERALALRADDLDAAWGLVRLKRERPQEAAAYALRAFRAAQAAPLWQRPAAYRLCARIWLELKDYPKAAESLQGALDIDPDDLNALRALKQLERERTLSPAPAGERAARAGGPAAGAPAATALTRALESDPDDLEALRRLIEDERGRGRRPEAAAAVDRFMDAAADAPAWQRADAYRLIARIALELGDAKRASNGILLAETLGWRSIGTESLAYALERSIHPDGRVEAHFAASVVSAYVAVAQAHAALKDYVGTEKTLERALEVSPDDLGVLQMLVEAESARFRPQEAMAYAKRLVKAYAQASPSERSSAYQLRLGISVDLEDAGLSPEDRNEALGFLAEVEGMMPDEGSRRWLAGLYQGLNENHRPLAVLKLLLKDSPKDPGLWLEQADVARQAGDRALALGSLAKAESLTTDAVVLRRIAGSYRNLEEYRRSLAVLKPLLEVSTKDPGLWLEQADAAALSGDRDLALKSLSSAESFRPNSEARHRIALLYQDLKQYRPALALLEGLTREYPGRAVYFSDLGLCRYLSGAREGAVRDMTKALALDPEDLPSYLTLGAILTEQGRLEDALRLYDRGLARAPSEGSGPLRKTLLESRQSLQERLAAAAKEPAAP